MASEHNIWHAIHLTYIFSFKQFCFWNLMMHQWVRFSLECFSSMFYFDINFIWRLWCYLKCWLDDQKKRETNSSHSSSSNVCWMFEAKKTINIEPESTNWQIIEKCWFISLSDQRHAHRMSDEYDGSPRTKTIHLKNYSCWRLDWIVEIHLLQRFILLFFSFLFLSDRIVCCAVLLCIVYSKFTVCTCTTGLYAHKPYACVFRNFFCCLKFNAPKDQM